MERLISRTVIALDALVEPVAKRPSKGKLHKGRAEACRAIVCDHYEAIYRFMAYLTRDINLAEELTQETFACAWENMDSFRGRARPGTWLHRIAYHKFVDSCRRVERDAALASTVKMQRSRAVQNQDPCDKLAKDEDQELLYDALKSLNPPESTVIVLHYIQGLNYRQMARVLDEPAGTVKWRTSLALKKLRALLTGRIVR
jgi:RNA polymerase sigma-70 factor (ECF subfamily)